MPNFKKYAKYYNIIYRDKNYIGECNFLEKVFKGYSKRKIRSVLDLGCGTGKHTLILAKRKYKMVGMDLSLNMLDLARKRSEKEGVKIDFFQGDIKNFDFKKKFDAAISMFTVIGYLTENKDLISAFKSINNHLKRGGLFVFDCWFGPAVIVQKPQNRMKIIENNDEKIIRFVNSSLDVLNQTVDVNYKIIWFKKKEILEEFNELHRMRFLFSQEIKILLEQTGFMVLEICPFMKLKKVPTENDWSITVIAQKL